MNQALKHTLSDNMTEPFSAWKLEVAPGLFIAIRQDGIGEYVSGAETLSVPCAPPHASALFLWHDQALPVVNVANVMGYQEAREVVDPSVLKLAILRISSGTTSQLIALRLISAPERMQAQHYRSNSEMDNLPIAFQPFCLSILQSDKDTVMILNLRELLSLSD